MLEPHQLDPGAVDEDKQVLRLRHEDGGPAVTVVDRLYGTSGSYAVVSDGSPYLMLVPFATLAESFDAVDPNEEPTSETRDTLSEGEPGARDPAPPAGDEFTTLTGADLDDALDRAGIDPSTGGSRADGSLTAEERRQALRDNAEHRAASSDNGEGV